MPQIVLETFIDAPASVCFDLVRDPRLHVGTTVESDGRVIGIGQSVTFNTRKFGLRQRLTVEVTGFERPYLFVDEMTEGNFVSFKHIHEFVPQDGATLMRDTLLWTSPFGILGSIVDRLFLESHLRKLVSGRNARLKQIAENSAEPQVEDETHLN